MHQITNRFILQLSSSNPLKPGVKSRMQCRRKTFMVHQTLVWWALYIPYKFVNSPIRHLGLAIGNVRRVWRFSPTLEWRCSWSSADRRCSNYIWVSNIFIAYRGTSYIGLKVTLTVSAEYIVTLGLNSLASGRCPPGGSLLWWVA